MATVVSLDSIRAAAEKQYGSFDIDLGNGEVARLLNPLRLPKEVRAKLTSLEAAAEAAGDDADHTEEQIEETLRLLAQTPEQAEALFAALGGDLALMATIMEQYSDNTQAGEASPSQD